MTGVQPREDKLKVFVSYSRKDLAFAERIVAALEARGLAPKIDTRDLPTLEDWRRELVGFIREADAVVFIVSPNSISSPVCAWEVEQVTTLNKRLAPVVLERVADDGIPESIARISYLFFDPPNDFDGQADKLAAALQTDLAWIKEHTRLGEVARRWSERRQTPALLLRGQDIGEAEHWIASRPRGAPESTEGHRRLVADSRRAATRRQRFTVAGSLAVTAIAVGLAGTAFIFQRQAESNAAEAQVERAGAIKQRDASDAVRQFFQIQSLSMSGRTEQAQLLALELYDRLDLIEGLISKVQLLQLYYDVLSGPFMQTGAPLKEERSAISPPLSQLTARFVKTSETCEGAQCERLTLSLPQSSRPMEFDCNQLDLCHESSFSGEGLKRVIPHPHLPKAIIEIYPYGDWRLFDLATKSISGNVFPQQLTCTDECRADAFEACFIGKDAIFWRWRQLYSNSMVMTDYDGRTIAVLGGEELKQPARCLSSGLVAIPHQRKDEAKERWYSISQLAPLLRRYARLEANEMGILRRAGIASAGAAKTVQMLLDRPALLTGVTPDGELSIAFSFIGQAGSNEIGLNHNNCIVIASKASVTPWRDGETLHCLRGVHRVEGQGKVGLTSDGHWLVRLVEHGIEAWRILWELEPTVLEARRLITRCLTAIERRELLLEPKPPRWCITAPMVFGEGSGEPSAWDGKWPYHGKEWKGWLIASDKARADNLAFPPLPDGGSSKPKEAEQQ